MRKIVFSATALLIGMAFFSPADAEEWTSGFGQGFVEYTIKHGPGNEFMISCDEGFSEKRGEKTSVHLEIGGQYPRPGSEIKLILDGDTVSFSIDKAGEPMLDCHACSDNFEFMWHKLRSAKSFIAQYENGTTVMFDLKGVRKALTPKACRNPFTAF